MTEAPEGEYLPLDEQGAATIKLRSIFSGREVITEHVLREPNTEQMSRFQSLMSRSLIVKGRKLGRPETRIPSKARPLAKIYDELYESTSGYAEGGIPLHHKIAVINHHMTAQQEVLEGN